MLTGGEHWSLSLFFHCTDPCSGLQSCGTFLRQWLPKNAWGTWEVGLGPYTLNVLCDLGHVPASLWPQTLGYSLQNNSTQGLGCGHCSTLSHLLACLF